MFTSAEEVLSYIKNEGVEFIDIRFTDLPGVQQHFNVPAVELQRGLLHRGPDVRRLVDPRLRRDPQVRPEADPGPGHGLRRPVPRGQDAQHQPLDRRAAHRRALRPRPAPGGHQGRGVPEDDRHRRHRLLRPRGRVLHLRRGPLRVEDERRRATSSTPIEGAWNTGREEEGGNLGYKTRVKGGYFPVSPVRPLRRPARRDQHRADARPASSSSGRTTRSAPAARPRSTTSSTR